MKDHNRKVIDNQEKQTAPVPNSEKKEKPEKVSVRANTTFSWQDVGTWDSSVITDKLRALRVIKKIETYVIDHFYGDWYWNCSLMIGTCFFSWFFARIGGGILSLVMVLLFTNSVYRLEFRRFNRNIRDDMTRISASNRLENELETMEWLNSFLDKFWVIYMPALSEQVLFIANDVLKDQAPGFGIEALSLDEFTLGSKAPRVNSIKSYTKKGKDHIEMDWAFSFAPNDTDDMTKNEIKKKINPKVALGVTVGKAFISKSLPILVEDMSFTGRMNIKLKLSPNFPHVKMVSVQFLEAPTIDYALKPVGGDTLGLDIMSFIPGLSSFVNTLIHSNLRPMLYAPNSLDIDVEEIIAQQSNDSTGCVAVTIKRCSKLKIDADTKPNSINPYVQVLVQSNPDIDERTSPKKKVNDPIFLETKYLLVNKLDGNFVTLNVFDFLEDLMNDKLIGSLQIPLVDLLQKETQTGLKKNIIESGKSVGTIEFDLRYFPTLPELELDDGSKESNTDSEVGIMKLTLHEAKDLDLSKSIIGLLNPYAEIYVNDELSKSCRRLRQTNEPSWNQNFESLITQQSETRIQVLIKDSANGNVVGELNANLQDLIFETSRGQEWLKCPPLSPGGPRPRIRVSVSWKALGMTDDSGVDTHFNAPIGGMRVHLRNATDLKNLESVGEVDPYVKVMVNGKLRGKTPTIAETCDPVWDSVFFFPIDNEHQHLLLSIMDTEPEEKDRSLGSCAIHVNEFIRKNPKGNLLAYDGSNEIIEQPVLYNGDNHGYLSYSVSFIPTIPILTHSQIEHKDEYLKSLEKEKMKKDEQREREERLFKKYPDDYEWVSVDEDEVPDPERIHMPLDDIIKYRAGTMTVNILQARFSKPDLFVHTLFDDQALQSGVTPRSDTRNLNVSSSAEGFIRDLPNSKLIFRVAKKLEVKDGNDVVAERILDTIEILKRSYNKPIEIRVDERNVIKVQLEFIPSAVKLHPLDTILDVGHMKIEILQAEGLPSIDLNGKSDPLAVIKLDGIELFRTDRKRKTLDPVWNDSTEFPMLSRSRQVVLLEVYDWDYTHDDELLGRANLDLSTIDPFESSQFTVKLDTQGIVHLRTTFKPEYIRPPIGAAGGFPINLNDIAGAPLKVVGGAAGVAGSAVGGGVGFATDGISKGGSFLKGFSKLKRKKDHPNGSDGDKTSNSLDVSRTSGTQLEQDSVNGADGSSSTGGSNVSPSKLKSAGADGRKSQYANDLQSLRSGASPTPNVNAVPNIHSEILPPPQKPNFGHQRNSSDASSNVGDSTANSSFASSINGADVIPGRVTVVSATGYLSSSLDVKVSLKTKSKDKTLYKTRPTKAKGDIYRWSESSPFKCSPESEVLLTLRERHSFGKKVEIDTFTLPLSDMVDQDKEVTLDGSKGNLIVHIQYLTH